MENKYYNLVKSFKNLDIEEKKKEIINNLDELLRLLYFTNKSIDNMNEILPIYTNYKDDNEYYDLLFTYIISLKEENAKIIENINY